MQFPEKPQDVGESFGPEALGTWGTYQGFPLLNCHFVRSRGWGSDVSVVEIMGMRDLTVATPAPGEMVAPQFKGSTVSDDFVPTGKPKPIDGLSAAAKLAAGRTGAPANPYVAKDLSWEGALILAESARSPMPPIPNLFVLRAEAVNTPDGSDVCVWRLTLGDARYFYPHGVISRWSYNRKRADGSFALDSLKSPGTVGDNLAAIGLQAPAGQAASATSAAAGEPWNKKEIAQQVAASLFRSPVLAHSPEHWTIEAGPREFEPFAPAVEALQALVTADSLEEPVLRLDGTLALYKKGEGMIGYAPGGTGSNVATFPPSVQVYEDGTGQGTTHENAYTPDYCLVVGGERVASVSIDSWDPVLVMPDGAVAPLTEATIRRLTGGTQGMDWLLRFMLQPSAYQASPDIDDDVLELLRDQAGRVFRCPGVAIADTGVSPEDAPVVDSGQGGVKAAPATGAPPPNAHLLPLLDRAETKDAKRLPVKVETYRYTTVHQALRGNSPAASKLYSIMRAISDLRALEPSQAPEFVLKTTAQSLFVDERTPLSVWDVTAGEQLPLGHELQTYVDKAREISTHEAVIAEQLRDLTKQELEASEENHGQVGQVLMFDLARKLEQRFDELDKELSATAITGAAFGAPRTAQALLNDNPAIRQALLSTITDGLQEIATAREAQTTRARLGTEPTGQATGMVILANLPRTDDTHATVLSAARGLVRTSQLAVHVAVDPTAFDPGDPLPLYPTNPSHAKAVLTPVRVTFGCMLRPRLDRPSVAFSGRQATPVVPGTPGGAPGVAPGVAGPGGASTERAPVEFAVWKGAVDRLNQLRADATADRASLDQARASVDEARAALIAARVSAGEPPDPNVAQAEPDVIPSVLGDDASYYVQAYKRTGFGTFDPIPLDKVQRDQAVRVVDQKLVELVSLDGTSNRPSLDDVAKTHVKPIFSVEDRTTTQRITLARPWPVQCDGKVAKVEIKMEFEGDAPCGYTTTVVTGSHTAPPVFAGATVERPRASKGDTREREGVRP